MGGRIKFGPHFVTAKTPIDNIRLTTFFAGEHEVRIIDPDLVEFVDAQGCEWRVPPSPLDATLGMAHDQPRARARAVRERALIHVAGPKGAGKTTFIETMLGSADEWILAARCVRDDSLRESREAAPRAHPELRRYLAAGADGAAVFSFPESDMGSEAFFITRLMETYTKAVLLEGDNPLEFVDLAVFVVPPPPVGETLLVRRKRDRAKEERARADAMERMLRGPDGVAELLGRVLGRPIAELARRNPKRLEETRTRMFAGIARTARLRRRSPRSTGLSRTATRASNAHSSSWSISGRGRTRTR